MNRALLFALWMGLCVSLPACNSKKDADGEKASAEKKKDDHDHDHNHDHKHGKHDHDHGEHDHDHDHEHAKKDEKDPHAPSEVPLEIFKDIVTASDHAKQIFDNDKARVVQVELHKGESLPLHEGGPRVVYAVTDLDLKFDEVHGGDHTHAHEEKYSAGQVHAHGAGAHGVSNLADGDAEFIVFLRKKGDAFDAAVPEGAQTITEATKFAKRIFDNDEFRVIKVALPPGEKTGKHYVLNRIIYALDDFKASRAGGEGEAQEEEMKKGEVKFREAGYGELHNNSEALAMFLVVEMKK
ncbi:MAG: hypothetical protein MI757_05435 [Pirellulales bacterium]|nr:hypothetical protein [Pirellulales bacterium]